MKRMPWWRWAAATFVIAALWIYPAAGLEVLAKALVPGGQAWQKLLRDLVTFIPFFLATPLVWRYATGLPVARLVNMRGRIATPRIGVGFLAWFALSALSSGVDWLLHPAAYRVTFEASTFVPFALVVLLLLPLQSSAEELFFRGWILRWAHNLPMPTRVVISGLVFALPHAGNPEATGQAVAALGAWFLLGAGWAYVSVRDGGIELALGAHLANNLFSLLIVGYDGAALPTSAIMTTSALHMVATLASLVVMVPLFVLVTRPRTH
jgi:membrane protease YdiL (CAAX protease family)